VHNLSIKLYRVYACYMNSMLYDVIYSILYYLWFSVTAVGLGQYYPRIRRSTYMWSLSGYLWIESPKVTSKNLIYGETGMVVTLHVSLLHGLTLPGNQL